MMRPHTSLHGRHQRLTFVRSAQQCQVGQHCGLLLPVSQGPQNGAPGFAHQISEDRTELDVGLLQQLVNAIDVARALLLEEARVAGQVAQVALRLRRDERGFEQPVLQQIRNPFGILGVGFPPRGPLSYAAR
jgi:hypothetical protein